VEVIQKSTRNIYPVVDSEGNLLGLVLLDHIRHMMFDHSLYDTSLRDLMFVPSTLIDISESMEVVAEKFHETGNYNLPVVDNGKYVGFVSRARVFSNYRRMLKYFSED